MVNDLRVKQAVRSAVWAKWCGHQAVIATVIFAATLFLCMTIADSGVMLFRWFLAANIISGCWAFIMGVAMLFNMSNRETAESYLSEPITQEQINNGSLWD